MKWRDRGNDESKARLEGNSQHNHAKWQGNLAALLRNSHRDTIVEESRCGKGVTIAETQAWKENVATMQPGKNGDEEDDHGEAKWKGTTVEDQDDERKDDDVLD